MTCNPFHFRDLLTRETAHLSVPDLAQVNATYARALDVADQWRDAPCTPAQLPHALALKLLELPDAPPPWVRVLVAKAALEAITAPRAVAA